MIQCRHRHAERQKRAPQGRCGDDVAARGEGAQTAKNGRSPTLTLENRGERVFLAAVDADHADALWNVDDSLAELASLARTAGAEVVGTLSQRLRKPDPVTDLGKGRANQLAQLRDELDYDLFTLDDALAPSHHRNIQEVR